ncbi:MAG TPA: lipid-A-disaccharide synthase [Vicinamibacterales bacterium]|nr:lipid-A-disaccharide synthase [Vicinamibacterales bacterium]
MSLRLLLSCGEASGDLYAGHLTRELRALSPGIEIAGLAGPVFAQAGGRLLVDYRGLSVTGFTEIVAKVPQLRAAKQRLLAEARGRRPDALVVIDYFGFNGRLARDAHALGIPVIYYVSPQIWAWRPGRIRLIRRVSTRVLVIFPFEEAIYRDAGVPVEFVGHPLVDLVQAHPPRSAWLGARSLDPAAPTVAVLPGSRTSEVRRILPTLMQSAALIRQSVPAAQFIVARAPYLDDRLFEPVRGLAGAATVEGETDAVLAAADIVITASGTATVQAALHDRPMVVVYRVSPLEYRIGRPFVMVDTFAMVNLIAGSRIVPELIQEGFTAAAVAGEAVSMLTDSTRTARIRQGLAEVRAKLGGPGASRRAAEAILRTIGERCETA